MMVVRLPLIRFGFDTATVIWTAGVQGAVAGLNADALVESRTHTRK
jgi:hypothetical protein